MLVPRIQQHFFDSADLKYQVAETLSRPIADAAAAVLGCLTAGGKVLAAGSEMSAADAQRLVAGFVGRFERQRPGLAALALPASAIVSAALAREGEGALAAQVQALGSPGDVLLLLNAEAPSAVEQLAIAAAHDKDMAVIFFGGRDVSALRDALQETDVLISVPHERAARIREIHALAMHCLLDAVDVQLLGEQEPS